MTTTELNRIEQMKDMLLEDMTYRQVGEAFGITHQRVRQLVGKDPAFLEKLANERARKAREQRETVESDRIAALEAKRGDCEICGKRIPASRPSKYTCKPEHQKIWNRIRFHIRPDLQAKHRESQAKAILADETGETYTASQVEWAQQVLSDNPPPLRPPTFNSKNGEVRRVYEEWERDFPALARRAAKRRADAGMG